MNEEEKKEIKNEAVKLFLEGFNFTQVGNELGYSRQFITNLIKDDPRIQEKRSCTTIKVYKNRKNKKMRLGLSNSFLYEIGIDMDCLKVDYVDVFLDKEKKQIVIKKHDSLG